MRKEPRNSTGAGNLSPTALTTAANVDFRRRRTQRQSYLAARQHTASHSNYKWSSLRARPGVLSDAAGVVCLRSTANGSQGAVTGIAAPIKTEFELHVRRPKQKPCRTSAQTSRGERR